MLYSNGCHWGLFYSNKVNNQDIACHVNTAISIQLLGLKSRTSFIIISCPIVQSTDFEKCQSFRNQLNRIYPSAAESHISVLAQRHIKQL